MQHGKFSSINENSAGLTSKTVQRQEYSPEVFTRLHAKANSSSERWSVMILQCKFKSRIQGIKYTFEVPARIKHERQWAHCCFQRYERWWWYLFYVSLKSSNIRSAARRLVITVTTLYSASTPGLPIAIVRRPSTIPHCSLFNLDWFSCFPACGSFKIFQAQQGGRCTVSRRMEMETAHWNNTVSLIIKTLQNRTCTSAWNIGFSTSKPKLPALCS